MRKKYIATALILAASLSLLACSNTTSTPPDDPYSFIDYGLSLKELKRELGGKPDKKAKNGAMIDYTCNTTEYGTLYPDCYCQQHSGKQHLFGEQEL